MVFEEAASVSHVDTEEFTLQNKSPLSCPPCPPGTLSPSRVPSSHIQARAFSLNQNNALCLPVFSTDNKLVWVHSYSIAQEVAHAAVALYGAFGVFPYPTPKEMVTLARHCSLHVDQVRVWFMFQRLHYGISWDCADVRKVRKRLLGTGRRRPAKAAVEDPQAVREEEEEEEEEEAAAREDVLEEAGERGSSEGSRLCAKMRARGVGTEKGEESEGRGGGSWETGVRLEVGGEEEEEEQGPAGGGRPRKRKRGEKIEKGKTAKKRTREGKADKTSARDKGEGVRVRKASQSAEEDPPKRSEDSASADGGRAQVGWSTSPPPGPFKRDGKPGWAEGGTALLTNRGPVPESTATLPPASSVRRPHRRHRKKKNTPFDLLPRVQVSESPPASKCYTGQTENGESHAGRKADSTATLSGDDDGGLAPGSDSAHGNTSALGDLALCAPKAKARRPSARSKNKTKAQLDQLHRAFLACQYPKRSDYDQLSERMGLHRSHLIQWFCDTRYYVKNTQPSWITPREKQRVMGRLRQRQRMRHLRTVEATADREAASNPGAGTWRLKLEEQSPIPTHTTSTPTTSTTTPVH